MNIHSETLSRVIDDLRDDDHPKKAVQKLLTKTVAEHDYSGADLGFEKGGFRYWRE